MSLIALALLAAGETLKFEPNLWTRDPGVGTAAWDQSVRVDGSQTLHVRHDGPQDWSVLLGEPIPLSAPAVLRLSAKIRLQGAGNAGLSFVVRRGDEVLEWAAGERAARSSEDWTLNQASTMVRAPGQTVQPRLTGRGPADVWLGPVDLAQRAVPGIPDGTLPVVLENGAIRVTVQPGTLATETLVKKTGKVWRQRPATGGLSVTSVQLLKDRAEFGLFVGASGGSAKATVGLDGAKPEAVWELAGEGEMPERIGLPGALVASAKSEHILPMNMGVSFPAADPAVEPFWLVGYGGHGLSMAFFGLLDGGQGVLSILDRSDDIQLGSTRQDGRLEASPLWIGEKGRFGYVRKIRYVFMSKADHTAFAVRYRQDAARRGLVKTLAAKAKANPNVARVARAANFWTWGSDKLGLAKLAAESGFKDVLWSGGGTPEELRAIRKLGWVPSRYDIYQDVMDPSKFPDLPWIHGDWTTSAWPDKLVRDASGDWVKGWVVKDKAGKDVPCAVCCDVEAVALAKDRISNELKTHPFEARFIDTTTASEYRECYDPRHPMTRTDSRIARMKLLQLVTDLGLVTGSETGHEASVPHLVFFEGMMSLGPYRVPDSGTDPPKVYDELPDNVLTFQLGPKYRIPLWQLVYGDCTVSSWYWGDFNNKHLGTWTVRDQWNALYGTPPMYFTDLAQFRAHQDRFAESYRKLMPAVRATAMRRMVAHRFLSPDRTVQQTEWDNGVKVTANFGDKPFGRGASRVGPGEFKLGGPQPRG